MRDAPDPQAEGDAGPIDQQHGLFDEQAPQQCVLWQPDGVKDRHPPDSVCAAPPDGRREAPARPARLRKAADRERAHDAHVLVPCTCCRGEFGDILTSVWASTPVASTASQGGVPVDGAIHARPGRREQARYRPRWRCSRGCRSASRRPGDRPWGSSRYVPAMVTSHCEHDGRIDETWPAGVSPICEVALCQEALGDQDCVRCAGREQVHQVT